jgi:lysophospholipase L1-like esterase
MRFGWLFLILTAAAAVNLSAPLAAPAAPRSMLLRDGQKVLLIGDSITNAGGYVQYVDAFLRTRFPDSRFTLINLGLPSETVTGLSEPDHPFPRPNVHERLDRALARVKPDVVVACYGMNDGIYYPFAEERFVQYQQGIRKVVEKAKAAGASIILMTPPPFDPVPVKTKLLPIGAAKYSWVSPYERYDEVLDRYGKWLLTLREQSIPVADPHRETARFLESMRRKEPEFTLAGDGVHPTPSGHALVAIALLELIGVPRDVDAAQIDARKLQASQGQVSAIALKEGTLTFDWTSRLPMPNDPQWAPRLVELSRINERLNRHRLTVKGLPKRNYVLYEGATRLGEVTHSELEFGVDLLRFPQLTTNRNAAELLQAVQKRERLLSPAWVTSVGHTRPNTQVGLPLAEAERQAAPLEERIRTLSRPVRLSLRLSPVTL